MPPRPFRPVAALTIALAAGALAAGCGAATDSSSDDVDRFQGQQQLAARTIEDLEAAAGDGDEQEICGQLLTRELAGRLASGGRTCVAAVEEAIDDSDNADMTVEAVRVNGDRATARVRLETGDDDRRVTLQLVRESRRWRIAELP